MTFSFIKKIRLFFHPKKESYFALNKILGFFPKDISLYEEALLHKSSIGENSKKKFRNNERLEFLGDAILDAVVADIVFKKFKHKKEGFLTNTRSKIVKRETLNQISGRLGLNRLIVSSRGVHFNKNHILGNALEAFIGAVYLDQGYRKTYRFIEKRIITPYINIDDIAKEEVNFKSRLLEWCQKYRIQMEYQLLDNYTDRDNNPVFESRVLLNNLVAGEGIGYSKKESHQQAALQALNKIDSDKIFIQEVLDLNHIEEDQDEILV